MAIVLEAMVMVVVLSIYFLIVCRNWTILVVLLVIAVAGNGNVGFIVDQLRRLMIRITDTILIMLQYLLLVIVLLLVNDLHKLRLNLLNWRRMLQVRSHCYNLSLEMIGHQ